MSISEETLHGWEKFACSPPDSYEKDIIRDLLDENAKLKYEVDDPRFRYAGSRVNRQVIIIRNAEIEVLKAEITELKEKLK